VKADANLKCLSIANNPQPSQGQDKGLHSFLKLQLEASTVNNDISLYSFSKRWPMQEYVRGRENSLMMAEICLNQEMAQLS
jgi:hypothetical protein